MQFDAAIGGTALRKRTSLERVGNTEKVRAQNRDRIGHVDVVENVACTYAEGEVVTAIGIRRGVESATAAAEERAAAAAAPPPPPGPPWPWP